MKSPKFKFIREELEETFSLSALKEEWKERVRYQIRKQALFDCIEYRDFHEDSELLVCQVREDIVNGIYEISPSKRYLVEKSRGLCRQMTLVHPRDLLVLERLSRSLHAELTSKCPSSSAYFEPDDGNFMKGIQQIDIQYGSFASWRRFQKAILGFADENKYVVVTDVANFYDFINFQHLRNIVSSLADIRESIVDLLIHILNRLTWTPDFMPLSQIGMPQIETTATRVLANAMLFEIDKVCEDTSISNYARFMDDIDVGVDTITQAKCIVRDVDLTLQSRQLRLNSSKTKILSRMEAYAHFCIRENVILSRYEAFVESRKNKPIICKIILKRYIEWLESPGKGAVGGESRFRRGNGSKIHKRIMRVIYEAGGSIDDLDLLWLVKNDPAMRSTALRYLCYSRKANTALAEILKIAKSGAFVDDASMFEIVNFVLHAKFKKTSKVVAVSEELRDLFAERGSVGLVSAIHISARMSESKKILLFLQRNRHRLRTDFWVGRAIAGLFGRFCASSLLERFPINLHRILRRRSSWRTRWV